MTTAKDDGQQRRALDLSADDHKILLEAMRDYVTGGGEMPIGSYLDGDGMAHVTDPKLLLQYMRHRRASVRLYLRMVDEAEHPS